jgi:hypothetical protein
VGPGFAHAANRSCAARKRSGADLRSIDRPDRNTNAEIGIGALKDGRRVAQCTVPRVKSLAILTP